MSEETPLNESNGIPEVQPSEDGRQRQKIRIKYKQRVKIKKRPRGYKITRYWKKNKKSIFAFVIIALLLGATLYMVVEVAKQRLEKKQHDLHQRLRTN